MLCLSNIIDPDSIFCPLFLFLVFYSDHPLLCSLFCLSKGHVAPASSPAVPVSVFSRSGCVMDGTTALTEQMNRAVATPPTLPSVSPCYL